MAYKGGYDAEDIYPYREDRPGRKVLGYAAAFAAGLVVGALLFGPWLRGPAKKEPPPAAAPAAPPTAAGTPAPPPPPAPETAFLMDEPPLVESPPVARAPGRNETRTPRAPRPEEYQPASKTPPKPPALPAATRTPESIRKTVTRRLAGIQAEYDAQLKKNPRLAGGKIAVRFTISPRGDVTAAEVVEDTVGNAALAAGVVARVRSWKFAAASGETTVIYPFVFVAGR